MTALWAADSAAPWVDALAIYLALLKQLVPVVALGVLLSCLDDLAIDVLHGLHRMRDRLWRLAHGSSPVLTAEDMAATPADWIAVFVPALREADGIGAMLGNAVRALHYPRYRILVGTCPDDAETQAAVRAVAAADRRVLCIVADRPSSASSKAANLNVLYRAMLDLEARGHPPFKAVVLHDAGDVLHPLELHVFNWHIPHKALVQLPVLPLRHETQRWWQGWSAHTCLEEFAVAHARDMMVRNWLEASLPSTGIGCGFSRPALAALARQNDGLPFRTTSRSLAYDLGMSLGLRRFPALMARVPASRYDPECVATRCLLPGRFTALVRQRSRWLRGTALDGWRRFGWPDRPADRYMLLRDRKALPCAWLNLITLALAVQLVLLAACARLPSWPDLPPLVEPGGVTAHLLVLTCALLVWRTVRRACITARCFGLREGLASVPRSIAAIFLHAAAASLALVDDLREKATRRPALRRKTVPTCPVPK